MGFGEILQGLREETGLSQSQLALKSGTPLDSLRNWEQNRSLPKIDSVTRLARALGVSLDKLAYEGPATSEGSGAPMRDMKGGAAGGSSAPVLGRSTKKPIPPDQEEGEKKPRGRGKGKQ